MKVKMERKTNCYKVAKGLTKAGFPFSQNILASIERYSDLSNDLHSNDRKKKEKLFKFFSIKMIIQLIYQKKIIQMQEQII